MTIIMVMIKLLVQITHKICVHIMFMIKLLKYK